MPQELGAPNVVTGILITYRGFDTLGEVAVLFMVAAGVGLLLGSGPDAEVPAAAQPRQPSSELVRTGAEHPTCRSFLFSAYIIMNGHISAGGGFQGGAVVASGVVLLMLGRPEYRRTARLPRASTESLAGVLFVLVGILGWCSPAASSTAGMLPLGPFGALFSAGAIPILSVLLGIKVGCELSVIIDRFRG